MKVMQSKTVMCLAATVLSTSLLGVAAAQQESFPREREQAKSCAQVDWNRDMTRNHPRLIEACREVVAAGGEDWARFEAQFVRVEPDGRVAFSLVDSRDRLVEQIMLQPATGQVAYIDGRATPFSQLRSDQRVNLYVPEGTYGFVTQPGARSDQVAQVSPRSPATTAPASSSRATTRDTTRDTRTAMLPATAGSMPWFALGGFLALASAFGIRVGSRR